MSVSYTLYIAFNPSLMVLNPSYDIPHRVTSGVIFSTNQSATNLHSLMRY
jgi:hypothetical protein